MSVLMHSFSLTGKGRVRRIHHYRVARAAKKTGGNLESIPLPPPAQHSDGDIGAGSRGASPAGNPCHGRDMSLTCPVLLLVMLLSFSCCHCCRPGCSLRKACHSETTLSVLKAMTLREGKGINLHSPWGGREHFHYTKYDIKSSYNLIYHCGLDCCIQVVMQHTDSSARPVTARVFYPQSEDILRGTGTQCCSSLVNGQEYLHHTKGNCIALLLEKLLHCCRPAAVPTV